MMTATVSRLSGDVAFWDEFLATVRPRLGETAKFTREEPLAAKTTIRIGVPRVFMPSPVRFVIFRR